MNTVFEEFKQILLKRGLKVSFTDVKHIIELRDEIMELYKQKIISDELYNRYLYNFQFNYDELFSSAKSVITVAMPSPIRKINFEWKGKTYKLTIPSTYLYHEADELIEATKNFFNKRDFSIAQLKLPLKLLAARTGISKYGRNNISYTEEFGSFYRIEAFITDAISTVDNWYSAEQMHNCKSCSICLNACPTKAISMDRNVIYADKCLTFLNESQAAFPDWICNEWHNSIIGCMRCQLACPKNRMHLNNVIEYNNVFDHEEIELIINEVPFDSLPEHLKDTLDRFTLSEYYFDGKILGRNIRALINKGL